MKLRRTLMVLVIIVAVFLLAWAGYGWRIASLNRFPSIALPDPVPPPNGNIYDQYLNCIRQLEGAAVLAQLERSPDFGPVEDKQAILEQNRQVLEDFHATVGGPCGVTHLEPQPGDLAADGFRHLARLVAVEGKMAEQQGDPDRALAIYLDGLTYAEDVMRGGSTLHFTNGYLAETTLFQAIPSAVLAAGGQAAGEGAQRMAQLVENQYPLSSIFEQYTLTAMQGWQRGIEQMSRRGFRLDRPRNPTEKEFLYVPKGPFVRALHDYLQEWIVQAGKSYPDHQEAEYPAGVPGVSEMAVHDTSTMERHLARYTYKDTRLRLLYTALRLRAYQQAEGRYPASLAELGDSPWFTDPFSSKPFVYRPQGNDYLLYSVGPNGEDDGGRHFEEGKLDSRQRGDLTLAPTFVLARTE